MLFPLSLTLAASALLASASTLEPRSHPKLPLKHVSNVSDIKALVARGQARIAHINGVKPSTFSPLVASGPITNQEVSYVAPVAIGGKKWNLIVDTGSSNLWCGAHTSCEPTKSGKPTGGTANVTYGSGSFSGPEYTDKVKIAGLIVKKQSLGAASQSSGFAQNTDGILGLGPTDLTYMTVSNTQFVPTFMDNLYRQGSISTQVLGVYFKPILTSSTSVTNGELTFGGVDSSKYTGALTYFPQLTSGTASLYWGIQLNKIYYGSSTLANQPQAIVDTGTTLIYIPSNAYTAFLSLTGGSTDSSGLASFTTKPTQNFSFLIGTGSQYSLTPAQYLVPTAQYANFGLDSSKYYAWIGNGGSGAVSTIIGQKFLENYYSVYDTTNQQIGFAAAA